MDVAILLSIIIPSAVAGGGILYQYLMRKRDRRISRSNKVLDDAYNWTHEVLEYCSAYSEAIKQMTGEESPKFLLEALDLKDRGRKVTSAAKDFDSKLTNSLNEAVCFFETYSDKLGSSDLRVKFHTCCNEVRKIISDLKYER